MLEYAIEAKKNADEAIKNQERRIENEISRKTAQRGKGAGCDGAGVGVSPNHSKTSSKEKRAPVKTLSTAAADGRGRFLLLLLLAPRGARQEVQKVAQWLRILFLHAKPFPECLERLRGFRDYNTCPQEAAAQDSE
jgi:hypothetical protein